MGQRMPGNPFLSEDEAASPFIDETARCGDANPFDESSSDSDGISSTLPDGEEGTCP